MANQPQQPDTALHNASHLMQYHDLIESIVAALDARDAYTASHSDRVADMVLVLAAALGLDEDETTRIHMAAHLHDIGKNLVALMMRSANLEVIDLGSNVDGAKFIDAINKYNPDVIGLSALLTTTMPALQETVTALNAAPWRKDVKVMVGGAPITQEFADKIGADAYTPDAASAAKKAKDWAAADAIRAQLTEMGWAVKDTAQGPQLSKL